MKKVSYKGHTISLFLTGFVQEDGILRSRESFLNNDESLEVSVTVEDLEAGESGVAPNA